jgi:hypothetical protein
MQPKLKSKKIREMIDGAESKYLGGKTVPLKKVKQKRRKG